MIEDRETKSDSFTIPDPSIILTGQPNKPGTNDSLSTTYDNHILSKSEEIDLMHPIEVTIPCSSYPVSDDPMSSNGQRNISLRLPDPKSMSEDSENQRPWMATCSDAGNDNFNKEMPSSASYIDGGSHHTDGRCPSEAFSAGSTVSRFPALGEHISQEEEQPKTSLTNERTDLEEQNWPPHNTSLERCLGGLVPLDCTFTNSVDKNRLHTEILTDRPKFKEVNCSITCPRQNGITSFSGSLLGIEEHDDFEQEYEVESVEGRRMWQGRKEYLVNWTGYEDCTWESVYNLANCQLAIDEYEQRQPSRKRGRDESENKSRKRKSPRREKQHPNILDPI
ncbi:hypothetical protein EYR41_007691 [Orbilia oligospora]|uniref:Chromo domain-containing protein n=1 Tax=Orbilia oligospora TaxID=2813651 RepID=A0A8H2HNY2_ORBOL|nr:hypothetical protein EYR41_007691 [Orbilia oligospora]